jgi:signal transduction histidine kinase
MNTLTEVRADPALTPPTAAAREPGLIRTTYGRRSLREFAYAIVVTPLAMAGLVFTVFSVTVSVGLSFTFVGLPLLAATGLLVRGLGAVDRGLARGLLGEEIPAPARLSSQPGFFGWLGTALRDPVAWRIRGFQVVRFPLGVVTGYLGVVCYAFGLFWVSYPLWWQVSGPGRLYQVSWLDSAGFVYRAAGDERAPQMAHRLTVHIRNFWYADTWPKALLVMLAGIVLLLVTPWIVRGLVQLQRMLMRALLGSSFGAARVRELEAARTAVVEDAAVTLRRIERDLHDGTQAQLATLAMALGQAKEKLEHRPDVPYDPEGALSLITEAHRQTKDALVELRDIARGIHPPALDVGLDAALATLAARSGIPTELTCELAAQPSPAIERIAYFTVAELLTNAVKHSRATRVTVHVVSSEAGLFIHVVDDGIGGARPKLGSGLPGLIDRVRAVDGRLDIVSPPGGPTVVDVVLPLLA